MAEFIERPPIRHHDWKLGRLWGLWTRTCRRCGTVDKGLLKRLGDRRYPETTICHEGL